MDGGDGPRRNVAALLLKKEVQFILIVCVHLIALAAVVELTGTEGVERPPAGGVQRASAGCQGPQAAAGRHGQSAGGEAGEEQHTVKSALHEHSTTVHTDSFRREENGDDDARELDLQPGQRSSLFER